MPLPSLAEASSPEAALGQVISFLVQSNLLPTDARPDCEPLSGGVSSLIWLVSDASRRLVVKTPLQRLNVAAVWEAPLTRSDSEARWLETTARLVPGFCPEVLAYDPEQHLLALDYLDPAEHRVWKADLLQGRVDVEVAGELGARLGLLHRLSAREPALAERFANEDLFRALRIEPYFESLLSRHRDLTAPIEAIIATTLATRSALVHGDVSPKNILVGPNGPVLLDAETAHWGDPAFDVAFCLNHLFLKSLLPGNSVPALLDAAQRLLDRYLDAAQGDPGVEERVARLLPLLMLARVDGRSPAEYLEPEAQAVARSFGRSFVLEPTHRLAALCSIWKATVA